MATKLMVTVPDLMPPLLLYVAPSDHVVNGVLIHGKEEGVKIIQRPIYFVSQTLLGAKLNYTEIEKIAYAVLTVQEQN
jgi:hypothetical protein